jgi:hypothetical protein
MKKLIIHVVTDIKKDSEWLEKHGDEKPENAPPRDWIKEIEIDVDENTEVQMPDGQVWGLDNGKLCVIAT